MMEYIKINLKWQKIIAYIIYTYFSSGQKWCPAIKHEENIEYFLNMMENENAKLGYGIISDKKRKLQLQGYFYFA